MSATSTLALLKVVPEPGRNLAQVKPGLLFNLYHGDWDKVPDYHGMNPNLSGIAQDFSLANKSSEEKFSIDYQGFIKIPADGIYTLSLSSDDGSLLYVGEKLVIDNDGLHGATTKSADLALGQGLHSIRILFFEKTGGNSLQLMWKTGSGKPEPVPATAFFYYR
jgi:hypothetical protein